MCKLIDEHVTYTDSYSIFDFTSIESGIDLAN